MSRALSVLPVLLLGLGLTAPLEAQTTSASGTNTGTGTGAGAGAASGAGSASPMTSASTSDTDGATAPVVDPVTQPRTPPPSEEEEDEGDGRNVDFLWIELQGGVSNVNLIQFSNANFADVAGGASVFNEVYGTGPAIGLGVGFRVWWLAVGARATFAIYDGFQIGTIGGEATLRFPIPVVEPWIRVGLGFAWQGDANYRMYTTSNTTTYGWVFQSMVGLDIYLANWFTIGGGFGVDILNMSRQRDPTVTCMGVTDVCPGNPGDAVGLQLKGLLTVGFRF
jgi:hypothetical protein